MIDYIYTYTGKKFYPFDPNPDDLDIIDIAHALSNVCRFTGHTKDFYSVAQHSCFVSLIVQYENPRWALEALLHDASEAYIADVATPVKPHFNNYREIEERIMKAINVKWNLDPDSHEAVKKADDIAFATEVIQLMPLGDYGRTKEEPLENVIIYPFSPRQAENSFCQFWAKVLKERN